MDLSPSSSFALLAPARGHWRKVMQHRGTPTALSKKSLFFDLGKRFFLFWAFFVVVDLILVVLGPSFAARSVAANFLSKHFLFGAVGVERFQRPGHARSY